MHTGSHGVTMCNIPGSIPGRINVEAKFFNHTDVVCYLLWVTWGRLLLFKTDGLIYVFNELLRLSNQKVYSKVKNVIISLNLHSSYFF